MFAVINFLISFMIDSPVLPNIHDDVIKWKHFPCYWPFVRGIHRSPVNSPQKGQWRRALMFSLICAWINGWVNRCDACNLRRHRAHYDITVMSEVTLELYVHNLWDVLSISMITQVFTTANTRLIHFTYRKHLSMNETLHSNLFTAGKWQNKIAISYSF